MTSLLLSFLLALPAAAQPSDETPHDAIRRLYDNGVAPAESEVVGWWAGRGSWSSDPKNVYGAIVIGLMVPGEKGDELRLLPLTFPQADFYDTLDARKIKAIRDDIAVNLKVLPVPKLEDGAMTIRFNTINPVCASESKDPAKECLVNTKFALKKANKSFAAKVTSQQMPDVVYLYYYKSVTPSPAQGQGSGL